ncbi:hypothetical protein BSK63_23640 [Paenibacillus odorifer]|uniref:hypothetical protein n=1 Tax=Paenibacillus odorifer TaxID=189426 RepID=UPI00096DDF41|nr:hypothetical protein [Paenibacillus odorifer]OME28906.1 hypothetical protein BSK63_23640 [Paenibacillus odorifer]
MKIIKTLSDIQELKLTSAFPLPFIGYIKEQWLGLFEEQREEQDTMHSFSLGFHGHIIIFEPGDNGYSPLGKIDSVWVEYVDEVHLENVTIYRIGVLLDNDIMVLLFSMKDFLSIEIETWLAEQANK